MNKLPAFLLKVSGKAYVATAFAVGAAAFAFAASNTVPSSSIGSGTGTVTGYTISSLGYTLNSTNPQNVDAVTFSVSPTTATTVKVRPDGTNWYSCTNTSGSVSCATTSPSLTASSVSGVDIVAK